MALYSLHLSVFLRVRRVYDFGLVNKEFFRLSNKIERFRSRIMLHLFDYRTHKEFRVRFHSTAQYINRIQWHDIKFDWFRFKFLFGLFD